MPPSADPLVPWHDFYLLLGTASATMVGLLFVAASVASGVFSSDRRAPLRVFLSASVVNFSLVLATSLIAMAPIPGWMLPGALVGTCGVFGLTHSSLAWRDTLHDGLIANIDLEDRTWYIALPLSAYLCLLGSGGALSFGWPVGRVLLAASAGMLLAIGIHNAWDITVWIITRRRD